MKRYLITGASRGIGRAIATRLASRDTTLLLHGRDEHALATTCKLCEQLNADTISLRYDLSDQVQINAMLEQTGAEPIDALINNAGIALVKPFDRITVQEWEKSIAINVTAPFMLIQNLSRHMISGSSIVNVLSIAAKTGFPGWSGYSMTKFALEGFSQSVREELRPRGIRVINVYPAATNTEIWNGVEGNWPKDKMLLPADIADAIAYALLRPSGVVVETIGLSNLTGTL